MSALPPGYEPEFQSIKHLLLDLARERELGEVLSSLTRRMAERPHVILAQVWLVQPGDLCESCPNATRCPDRQACLHLEAAGGRPGLTLNNDRLRRIPLGVGELGRVASEGKVVQMEDPTRRLNDPACLDFARRHGVVGFVAVPVAQRGAALGVFAVWLQVPAPEEGVVWMRLIADHLAAAVINARSYQQLREALEENEKLRKRLHAENELLREEITADGRFGEMIGRSPALLRTQSQIEMVAPTDATVLILGESGSGKELVAREIHARSARASRPLVKVNCAAVPRDLFESEFFGHVRGAFTGAVRDRPGRFESSDGGSLFLDEVGEIPLELQGKLLRVLQDKTFERVGEERTRRVDVRLIAATNRDLGREVAAGRFREDLFYRLNVFPMEVAPLRRRREDIRPLAFHLLESAARRLNLPKPPLSRTALAELERYDWPGNIRELANVLERAVITWRGGRLRFDLPERSGSPRPPVPEVRDEPSDEILTEDEMRRLERENLRKALRRTGWKIFGPGGAAELLDVPPTTLASRVKRFGLRPGAADGD